MRQIHAIAPVLLALMLTSCAPNEGDVADGTKAPESAVVHLTIQRKSVGNIVSIDADDTQSIIRTDDGYQFSITGKFEEEVRVGDWVELIITNSTGEGGTQFLCTKFTDLCREIRSMHKFPTETTPMTGY